MRQRKGLTRSLRDRGVEMIGLSNELEFRPLRAIWWQKDLLHRCFEAVNSSVRSAAEGSTTFNGLGRMTRESARPAVSQRMKATIGTLEPSCDLEL
jgi:hypothetical protein